MYVFSDNCLPQDGAASPVTEALDTFNNINGIPTSAAASGALDTDEVFIREDGYHTPPLRQYPQKNNNRKTEEKTKTAAYSIVKKWKRDYFSSCKTGYQEDVGEYTPIPSPASPTSPTCPNFNNNFNNFMSLTGEPNRQVRLHTLLFLFS